MALKQWAMRHPIAAYIMLTLAWSWGLWSPLFVIAEPGRSFERSPPPSVLSLMLAGLFGPALAGVSLTGLLYGRQGLAVLGTRLRDARVGWWWLALLVIPLTYALLLSILMHVSLSFSAFVTGLTYGSIGDELTWTVIQAGLAWLVAGGFWLATRPALDQGAAGAQAGQGQRRDGAGADHQA